jgi:hypothetical protein
MCGATIAGSNIDFWAIATDRSDPATRPTVPEMTIGVSILMVFSFRDRNCRNIIRAPLINYFMVAA